MNEDYWEVHHQKYFQYFEVFHSLWWCSDGYGCKGWWWCLASLPHREGTGQMSSAAKSDPLHLQGLGQHLLHKAATEIFVQMNINVEVRRWGGAGRGGKKISLPSSNAVTAPVSAPWWLVILEGRLLSKLVGWNHEWVTFHCTLNDGCDNLVGGQVCWLVAARSG